MFSGKVGFLTDTQGSIPSTSNTVLLLHLDETPLVDSSNYNQPASLKGSVTIASAQSKFGGKSAYFNGPSTSDRIEISNNGQPISSLALGSDDFTIEFWVYFIEYDSGEGLTHIVGNHTSGVNADWLISIAGAGNVLNFQGPGFNLSNTSTFPYNNWVHVAVVRAGNVLKLFQNGFKVAEGSFSGSISNTIPLTIGGDITGTNVMKGYIDEVRIIKGQAVYNNDFSPPVSSYGSETSLLLHFDGANGSTVFTDSSSNNLTVMRNGNATISTNQSKFGGSAGYFNGTSSSSLSINSNEVLNLTGEVPYTIEFWMYMISYSNNYTTVLTRRTGINWQYLIGFSDPSSRRLYFSATSSGSGGIGVNTGNYMIPLNQWIHVAAVVNNGNAKLFIDGIEKGSGSWVTQPNNNANLYIAQQSSGGELFNGYIDELRIVKGEAIYTSNFTPPSLPFGATTSLLLHMDGANNSTTFTDSSPNNLIATKNGNPLIKTDQSIFGGSAAYFDGSSSLTFSQLRDFKFSNKDFTIECWIRLDDLSFNGICGSSTPGSLVFATANGQIWVGTANLGPPTGWAAFSGDVLSPNIWYHVAATRSLGKIRVFVNGTKVSEITESRSFVDATSFMVGGLAGEGGWYFNGYIDELRFIKGASLYNSNFTPPNSSFS